MSLDTPELLALALIGVYLVDSMHWLRVGEAVVLTRGGELRRLSLGSGFELGGRRPFLPNPFTPFWPALRVHWMLNASTPADPEASAQEMRARAKALTWVGILSGLCALAIVVCAPLSMLLGRSDFFLICVLVCLLSTLASATILFLRRKLLGLSTHQWLSLSFFALVCLPMSGNLARAVARHSSWALPADRLALLPLAVQQTQTRAQLREALRAARRFMDEDSAQGRRLAEQLRLLEE